CSSYWPLCFPCPALSYSYLGQPVGRQFDSHELILQHIFVSTSLIQQSIQLGKHQRRKFAAQIPHSTRSNRSDRGSTGPGDSLPSSTDSGMRIAPICFRPTLGIIEPETNILRSP